MSEVSGYCDAPVGNCLLLADLRRCQREIERLRGWLEEIRNGEHSHVVHGLYAEPCHVDCPVFNAKCALETLA